MDSELAFKAVEEAFARAKCLNPHQVFETFYIFGGWGVRMRVVGRRLMERIGLPLAHLRTDKTHLPPLRLTIDLWDQCETNIPSRIAFVRDDLDLNPIFATSADARFISYQLQHSLTCINVQRSQIIGFVSSAEELSLYECGRPLHVPLTLWHNSQAVPVIHAGLVAKNNRGVLFAGSGGTGKSTSAITCACAGFGYLSDDLIGLALSDDSFIGHSLYNSTFLEPDHLERFPLLRPHALKGKYPYEKKVLILLAEILSLRLERAARIHAIVLPRVTHGLTSRLRPASKRDALLALAPSSLLVGQRTPGLHGFNKLARLVEQTPCHWLELGRALDEIPCRVEELLAEVTAN